MRTRVSLSLTTVCLLVLTLMPARASAQSTAEARKSYDAAMQDAKRMFLKCDANALAAGVTEDYTGLTANGHVTKGRAGELQGDRELCAANTITAWDVTTTAFHSSGPVAWAAGTVSMTMKAKATGKVQKVDYRFLAAYDHQPGGKWLQQYFVAVPLTPTTK